MILAVILMLARAYGNYCLDLTDRIKLLYSGEEDLTGGFFLVGSTSELDCKKR